MQVRNARRNRRQRRPAMKGEAHRRRPEIPATLRQRRVEGKDAIDAETALAGEQRQQRRMADKIDRVCSLFAQYGGVADELDHVAVPRLAADQQGLSGQRLAGPARAGHPRGEGGVPAARLQAGPAFLIPPLAHQQVGEVEARGRMVRCHGSILPRSTSPSTFTARQFRRLPSDCHAELPTLFREDP